MSHLLHDKPKGFDSSSFYSLGSTVNGGGSLGLYDPSRESKWTRLGLSLESFKRAPGSTGCVDQFDILLMQHVLTFFLHSGVEISGDLDDLEKLMGEAPMLQPKMKARHLTMIAVAGSIGTGLFVGSGSALAAGGPVALIIAYVLVGIMMINVTQVCLFCIFCISALKRGPFLGYR